MPKRQIIIPIGPSIAYVPLTQNQFAAIEIDDIPLVDGVNWCAVWRENTQSFYAVRTEYRPKREMAMHRVILGIVASPTFGDHQNHQTLDNRRHNLREASPTQSVHNRRGMGAKSGVKGVYKRGNSFRVGIGINGKVKWLGSYSSMEEALKVRRLEAERHHGEFACHE